MNKRKTKKPWLLIIGNVILLFSFVYLYYQNYNQNSQIKQLENKLEIRQNQEKLIVKYQQDLATIKTLKQDILGQNNKLDEYSEQIQIFTDKWLANQEKLLKLEKEIEK